MPTRMIVGDDHLIMADGIEPTLETCADIAVVATLCNGQEVVSTGSEHPGAEGVPLDLDMLIFRGPSATERIIERFPTSAS